MEPALSPYRPAAAGFATAAGNSVAEALSTGKALAGDVVGFAGRSPREDNEHHYSRGKGQEGRSDHAHDHSRIISDTYV